MLFQTVYIIFRGVTSRNIDLQCPELNFRTVKILTENTIVLTGGTTCTVTMPTGFAGRNVTIVNKNSGSATASGITILTATTCKFHYVNAQWYLIERVANV